MGQSNFELVELITVSCFVEYLRTLLANIRLPGTGLIVKTLLSIMPRYQRQIKSFTILTTGMNVIKLF
jgi:hypothetical protein